MKKLSVLLLLTVLLISAKVSCLPVLNSLPSAEALIYLDFDGSDVTSAYWNGGTSFNCASSGMSDIEIVEVFNRVAEDYRPFNINISTDEAKFLNAPLSARIRIIVTSTSGWFRGVGGVAFIGSFTWGDDTPAFVFTDRLGPKSPKMVAECCSHESGHTLGLSHQSAYDTTCNLTAYYNDGKGSGQAGWAPIMGNSYYRNMSVWSKGPTPYGCSNIQDNLFIITSQNNFGYRPDDYSDDINERPEPFNFTGNNIKGIISKNGDKDAFTFQLSQRSLIHIGVKPFSVDANCEGANLDVKMSLYNSSKALVRTFDPAATMDVMADTILDKGSWYIVIDGAGNDNVNDYGSLGSYSLYTSANNILPIFIMGLTGVVDKKKHFFNWNVNTDQQVTTLMIESSTDGIHFSAIDTINAISTKFTYMPTLATNRYYRLKAVSGVIGIVYSNTIILRDDVDPGSPFKLSTFVHNEIIVNSDEDYKYIIRNVNGKAIARGSERRGFNKIDMAAQLSGLYIVELLGITHKQTARIIKQ